MSLSAGKKLLGGCKASQFVGRSDELERIVALASGDDDGVVLLAEPSAGSSELLRQAYDRCFFDQTKIIPIYFEVRPSDKNIRALSMRFVREFLLQTVAFRRQDAQIIHSSPELDELAEIAPPSDGYWIDRLIEAFRGESKLDDDRSFARNSFSAPLRAAGHGAKSFVMIDGLQNVRDIENAETFLEDLCEIFGRMNSPFSLCGHRRALFAKAPFRSIRLDRLTTIDAAKAIEKIANDHQVKITDQTRDLIAVQLRADPRAIDDLFAAATDSGVALDNFEKVQQVYTDEIFGGRIARRLDAIYDRAVPGAMQSGLFKLLTANAGGRSSLESWQRQLAVDPVLLRKIVERLNEFEVVNLSSDTIDFASADFVFADHAAVRSSLASNERPRGMIVGEALAANIRRAPQLMARHYHKSAAIGLRELLEAFDGRLVPISSIDHATFKAKFQGTDEEEIFRALQEDDDKIALPRVVYCAPASAFYTKLNEITDEERAAVAIGFDEDEKEIAILAAEIDSKLEATRELTEFWCDRLEMIAHNSHFENFRFWLVTPEGFDEEAMSVLSERNAYGSNRRQALLVGRLLNVQTKSPMRPKTEEYEIVVPMGDDTEIISARAAEDIARRHNFSAKSINQIKTALVEACINATEHSLSPDRRIYQKFVVDHEKLVITVVNRGVRLADKTIESNDNERRGWGLRLMRSLMDDVRIEHSDDGTRLTLVKFLDSPE